MQAVVARDVWKDINEKVPTGPPDVSFEGVAVRVSDVLPFGSWIIWDHNGKFVAAYCPSRREP